MTPNRTYRGNFDANERYDTDTEVCQIRIFLSIGSRDTYITPSPNIMLRTIFLPTAICKPHNTGIGSTTTVTSIRRLNIPMNKSSDF